MTLKVKRKITYYVVLALGIAAALVWFAVFQIEASGGFLRIYFFDVGQGDAIFIESPGGNQVLIDGGPDNSVLAKLGEVMPFWDRSIDLVILTHPHADHLDGLVEVLKRYDVGTVLESGVNHTIPEYAEWHELLEEKNVKVVIAKAGQRIQLSDAAYLDILTPLEDFIGKSPKDMHDATVVSKLTYASTAILFMADAERPLEFRLLDSSFQILDSDILKAGHHGSKTSSSEGFLEAVSPEIAVISTGKKNRYGHPHQEVIDRLNKLGIKIFRTDTDGDVTFVSNGVQFSLDKPRTEK
ncbi:MAG: ComEC/Rec2 family competence protein [Candidatus Sungiibacteriota bacterium]